MKKFQILFFFFVSISIIISCEDSALFNSGDSIKKDIIINEPFDLIEIENTFDVILIKDTCNFIQVICGANLQKFIKISINQRTLYLNHIVRTNWSRKYKKIILELHLKDMHKINIRKPISLTTKEVFNSDSFYIDDWGKYTYMDLNINAKYCLISATSDNFGYCKIKGKCNYSDFYPRGTSKIIADSLKSDTCYILQRSLQSIYVNVKNQLIVEFETNANVFYNGNPTIIITNNPKNLIHFSK